MVLRRALCQQQSLLLYKRPDYDSLRPGQDASVSFLLSSNVFVKLPMGVVYVCHTITSDIIRGHEGSFCAKSLKAVHYHGMDEARITEVSVGIVFSYSSPAQLLLHDKE